MVHVSANVSKPGPYRLRGIPVSGDTHREWREAAGEVLLARLRVADRHRLLLDEAGQVELQVRGLTAEDLVLGLDELVRLGRAELSGEADGLVLILRTPGLSGRPRRA
jgi:hypothetical protein